MSVKRSPQRPATPRPATPRRATARRPQKNRRLHFVVLCLSVLLLAVVARAYVLQLERNTPLKKMAEEQYLKEIEIPARRGAIYDRAGNALAVSNQVESVFAEPQRVSNAHAAAVQLGKILGMKPSEVQKKLQTDRLFVWIKRRVDPAVAAQVKALGYPFIGVVPQTRRYYPNRSLFSHVLGAVDMDERGIEGLEAAFEAELAGTPSTTLGLRDARGRTVLYDGAGMNGVAGSDVYLTVDREIQAHAEAALAEGVQRVRGKHGTAIVMDPNTGDILALANYPDFNPNAIEKVPLDVRRNRAVTDLLEPGSTFKTVLMGAALEEGVIRPTDQVFCENGSYRLGGETIHDVHPHGLINAKKIIASSSNIGVAKLAVQLGRERFGEYIKAFGFGVRTGLELPGEAPGIVRSPKKWPLIQLGTVAFGQGISVNAMQLAAAYSAIATGGIKHEPRIVRMIQAADGTAKMAPRPPSQRVISQQTARELNEMLVAVINDVEGTGASASLPGIQTAGKTATAQKVIPGVAGYAPDKYIANFVGYLPADNPRAVIVVIVDEPEKTKHFGAIAAAPIFKQIALGTMQVFGLVPPGEIAAAPAQTDIAVQDELGELEPAADTSDASGESATTIPDVRGLSLREALAVLKQKKLRLAPEIYGSGKVVSQEPTAGAPLAKARHVKLFLATYDRHAAQTSSALKRGAHANR